MYTGDNKTALTSQRIIANTLLDLMSIKSFTDISISELCKQAQVSRQTFYTLFHSKEYVIIYELENKYPFTIEELPNSEKITLNDLCHFFSLYVENNYYFLKLVINNGLSLLLFNGFYNSLLSCKRAILEEDTSTRDYIAFFTAGGFTRIIKNYVNKGPFNDASFIENITYALFSGHYFNR
ncbi:MAG: TetR/AcrR family transcriptional regulator [Lachnotalea sp.]